ncbi:MAG: S-methyl-5'-thioadenosine phosphorylase [Lentisphaeraceae bacterium]|nr:S-methyl-5'-thioadenosine phosphorylase [Lentisphaeraceae bacterium]
MNIGIIGGSGLYDIDGLEAIKEHSLQTPYGDPSANILEGKIKDQKIFFLTRHGKGHKLLPHELNHKANIWAMKSLGVEAILSFSAVGSLKEEIKPCDIVLVDQYIDHTKRTDQSFFGNGAVAHVSLATPSCQKLSSQILDAASDILAQNQTVHASGTYINIQGPQFSTKAESKLFRQWDIDVIGMTNFSEAKLAREAEICYLTIAMVTDYDCWHPDHDAVTVDQVIQNLLKNAAFAKELILKSTPNLAINSECNCQTSLAKGLLTPIDAIPKEKKEELEPILRKYL